MAIAVDASSPVVATVTGTTTVTTASFTPPAGSILVVGFSGNTNGLANPPAPTIADNRGAPLTYTRRAWQSHPDAPNVAGHVAMWTAPCPTSVAMTITVTTSGTGTNPKAIRVWVITGQDTTDPIGALGQTGSASTAAINQAYTAETTGAMAFGAVCDWDFTGVPSAGTGCTADNGAVGTDIHYSFVRRTSPDGSAGVTNNLRVTLGGTSTNVVWCWVEINPLAGGGTTHTVDQTDSAGLTDTSTVASTFNRTLTDSAGLTDSATTAMASARTQTDSTGLTDTTAMAIAQVYTDSAGLTDNASVQAAKLLTPTDDAGLTDTTAMVAAYQRTLTDDAGLTDGATVAATFTRAVTDSAGLTDTATVQSAKLVTQTDSVGLTDSQAYAIANTHTDSAGLTDGATVTGGTPADPAGPGIEGSMSARTMDGVTTSTGGLSGQAKTSGTLDR